MVKPKITYQRVTTTEELKQILKLQKENLPQAISHLQQEKEGFVTVRHSFNMLKRMNDACAHSIAKCEAKVIGYALSMCETFKDAIPVLVPMFKEIDNAFAEQGLRPLKYLAMGQICVEKNHRGQGVFRGLYHFMKQELQGDFDAIITEVDTKNQRSSQAHKAIGFRCLKNYTVKNKDWELIILNIQN